MIVKYVRANNFGLGFITHVDRANGLNFEGYHNNCWKISGDSVDDWIARVGGIQITETEFTELSKVVVPKEPMTTLQFRNLFTQEEKVAIYTAAETNVEIKIWLDDLNAATEVKTDYKQTVDGVRALESAGLIATGRADEILGV